ncbi:MAG: acetyl/propionyl/methylcrotonyl-CoA carboxylase subunit alpha [Acidobacteria bacterium]|nr:acetyl/propionyl/methylcrotonyl-CoA carboxylase subunit alpha [Acidobacteriota bacterium]
MFKKILIANRGEIACRVIGTARRLGIATVAVHSEADAAALHVALADEAVEIGPAPARDSYLRGDRIIAAARRTGAAAIHPGYGFLSENAGFAEDCAGAGLVFIGPGAAAIRAMGSKSAAKSLMEKAGVPVVPGYHGADQADDRLRAEADRSGYPVMLKPSAGGGGKGMRVVRDASQFDAALASARREAGASFGDAHMLIERFVTAPRHIEIQVFADAHGNALHLFERDCSVQRRHQKIVEEAPAPGLSEERRLAMGRAAVDAAKAVGYLGAGTVEFIVDAGGRFFFMEMNTRLQVEHPVTELITGQDLVEWQLLVAAGKPLPLSQGDLAINGHAIEARLYAEDPDRDFLPATGRLRRLRYPPAGRHVRVDTGVREGDPVSIHYDPLIAKLIAWDTDRAGALRHLQSALRETRIAGVTTNLAFLTAVAAHDAFAVGGVDTGFIDRHRGDLAATGDDPAATGDDPDPNSPWSSTGGWRLNAIGTVAPHVAADPVRRADRAILAAGGLTAPMPGRVTVVNVSEGDRVQRGDTLLVLEAMKMEHSIVAPADGVVERLHYGQGDLVDEGAELLVLS